MEYTIYQLKETAPTNDEAKAQLNIDYQNETISINTGYDLASDNNGTEITNFSSILDNTQPTVYVRKKATDANHSASDWVEVTLAARPTEPTGLGYTSATSGSSADGTITGVNSTMEYSSDGTNWHDVTGTTITGLNDLYPFLRGGD